MQEFLFVLRFLRMIFVASIPTSDPYAEASRCTLFWNTPSQKKCSLSHKEIIISSRVITLSDNNGNSKHFDIYHLAIALLRPDQPFLCRPFSAEKIRNDDLKMFFKFFNIKKEEFTSVWESADYSETIGADALIQGRLNLFANKISASHRFTLGQYTTIYSSQKNGYSCCRPDEEVSSTSDLDI